MKLITEQIQDNLQYISEGADGEKKFRIEGVFMQANKVNQNKRIYRKAILEKAVSKYVTEQVSTGRAVGELNHPEGPTVNLDKVSHRITTLSWTGDNVMGKALILNTPMGNIVKGLLEGGVRLGVSTRGLGSLESVNGVMSVKPDFILSTIDIVQDPSAPDAFVNGIMEGVEYFISGNEVLAERIKKQIHSTPSRRLVEAQLKVFSDFMIEISNKKSL